MQLNAINRLQRFMGKDQKEAHINSFIFSNFNYCPLVWHFCSCKSSQKIEKIQLRCLRIIYNDYSSDYQTLLNLSQKPSMEIKRLRNLALEIFKTINDLNPSFTKSIFLAKLNTGVRPNDILVKTHKSATFGDKSLARLGPIIRTPKIRSGMLYHKTQKQKTLMLKLRNILQRGFDLNANVTYAVSITVKTMSLSNKFKIFSYFNVY